MARTTTAGALHEIDKIRRDLAIKAAWAIKAKEAADALAKYDLIRAYLAGTAFGGREVEQVRALETARDLYPQGTAPRWLMAAIQRQGT